MLQVLKYQQKMMPLAVLGKHHLPSDIKVVSFFQSAKLSRNLLSNGKKRVFHARRNDEIIQALLLKYVFRAKIAIVFTTTSQRTHSWITRFLVNQADGIITTSQAANHYIKEYRADGADIIIPHGIDTERYQPCENRELLKKELGLVGKYHIGIFGRVRHQKGIDILIKALIPLLKNHPDFSVIICGKIMPKDEIYVAKLKKEISAAGLNSQFNFLGEQPFDEIPKLMRAMTITAAMSRNEGFGLTVLEAMASGATVIASEAGAWKEIIEHEVDGYTVPCDDINTTQQTLEKMISSPEDLNVIAQRGRDKIIQKYKIEHEAERLCDFLKSKN